jgi:hypothetical protein
MSTMNAPQYSNQPLIVPVARNMLTSTAAPSQKIKFPTVSAVLPVGECMLNLSAKIRICRIPTAKSNCIKAVYTTACDAGFSGPGNDIVELEFAGNGNDMVVMSWKKALILAGRSGVVVKTIPIMIKTAPMDIAEIKPSPCPRECLCELWFSFNLFSLLSLSLYSQVQHITFFSSGWVYILNRYSFNSELQV